MQSDGGISAWTEATRMAGPGLDDAARQAVEQTLVLPLGDRLQRSQQHTEERQ